MSIKNFLIEEARKIFGGTEETICALSKKIFVYIIAYGVLMLLTFAITTACAATHAIFFAGIFGFLLSIGLIVISILYGLFVLCIATYYAAYFFRKGWDR